MRIAVLFQTACFQPTQSNPPVIALDDLDKPPFFLRVATLPVAINVSPGPMTSRHFRGDNLPILAADPLIGLTLDDGDCTAIALADEDVAKLPSEIAKPGSCRVTSITIWPRSRSRTVLACSTS